MTSRADKKGDAMKAVLKTGPDKGAELLDMTVPEVGPRDVLIKVLAAAICGSDVHIYNSSPTMMAMLKPPVIFGHEVCGEVVEMGSNVKHLKAGDLVAVETHIYCGVCRQCLSGNRHICEKLAIFGVHGDGAFAEYARVPERVCWKLAPGTSPDLGAVLEPSGVGVHGLLVEDIVGRSVAVFGCGPIGNLAVQAGIAGGASRVYVVETSPARLALMGRCTPEAVLINPREADPVEIIRNDTDGGGADICLDYSGSEAAIRQALEALKPAGRMSLVGVPAGSVSLNLHRHIVYKEARLLGISGRLIWKTWQQVAGLLESSDFKPEAVVTHRFPLSEFAAALELAAGGETGKILLYP